MYMRKPTGVDCSVYATCLLKCYCVKVSLTPLIDVQTRIRKDIIQSPRGQINVPKRNSFDNSVTPSRLDLSSNHLENITPLNNINTDHTNQLVWTNPIRSTLNPQIIRQILYSDTLHHMAQPAKTPLGVNLFWEVGAPPPIEWKQWFATLKMAIMARDNIKLDKLLKLKQQPADLFYPPHPTYEEELEGETDEEGRKREQRNERRRVDFENECKVIERKGALVDRIPWD